MSQPFIPNVDSVKGARLVSLSHLKVVLLTRGITYDLPFTVDTFKDNHERAIGISDIPCQEVTSHNPIRIRIDLRNVGNFKL